MSKVTASNGVSVIISGSLLVIEPDGDPKAALTAVLKHDQAETVIRQLVAAHGLESAFLPTAEVDDWRERVLFGLAHCKSELTYGRLFYPHSEVLKVLDTVAKAVKPVSASGDQVEGKAGSALLVCWWPTGRNHSGLWYASDSLVVCLHLSSPKSQKTYNGSQHIWTRLGAE